MNTYSVSMPDPELVEVVKDPVVFSGVPAMQRR